MLRWTRGRVLHYMQLLYPFLKNQIYLPIYLIHCPLMESSLNGTVITEVQVHIFISQFGTLSQHIESFTVDPNPILYFTLHHNPWTQKDKIFDTMILLLPFFNKKQWIGDKKWSHLSTKSGIYIVVTRKLKWCAVYLLETQRHPPLTVCSSANSLLAILRWQTILVPGSTPSRSSIVYLPHLYRLRSFSDKHTLWFH